MGSIGRSNAQTISKGLGMAMLSLHSVNFLGLSAIPAPPPRFAPGLGVEIYEIPCISNISSILY